MSIANLKRQKISSSVMILFKRNSGKEFQRSPASSLHILDLSQPNCMSNKISIISLSLLALTPRVPYLTLVFIIPNLLLFSHPEKEMNNTLTLDFTGLKCLVVFLNYNLKVSICYRAKIRIKNMPSQVFNL